MKTPPREPITASGSGRFSTSKSGCKNMFRNRFRFVWPVLCALLIAALAISTNYWRKKLRAATAQVAKKPKPKPVFDKRDTGYFRALGLMHGYEVKQPINPEDAARLAAFDRIELNKYWMMAYGRGPTTFPTRAVAFTSQTNVPLAPTIQLPIDEPFTHYRYELTNISDRTLVAPILFQQDRWDSAEALVAQAGFKAIPDEVDRAIAIWRYVCERRVFGDPPTEGSEEHDVLKFLGIYGYGFCDDTARAVATLGELSGLRGRVWSLDGHVVAEVMAGGRWRMLDADQQAYFHRAGAPQDLLGVEELAADRSTFDHCISFDGVNQYSQKFMDCFLTRENNELDQAGTSEHRLQPVLRAGERMALTNYNWGNYFLGKYPTPPPRFYNGSFTYAFHPSHLSSGVGKIAAEQFEGGHRLSNQGSETATATLEFAYPFPIVGGAIHWDLTVKGNAGLRVEDREHDRIIFADFAKASKVNLDRFTSVLTSSPTYRYTVTLNLEPGAIVELRKFEVVSDFQFAPLALVNLRPGANEFHAYFPEGTEPSSFELVIATKEVRESR
jgi:hypothetical protein